jgi:NAD+ synthase
MMTNGQSKLRLMIGQLNPTVGDLAGNLALARKARHAAATASADLLVLTELFISGYPPEDLVLRPAFIAACQKAIEALAGDTADGGPAVVIGAPWEEGGRLHNAALFLDRGRIAAVRHKVELPNYGVFDEGRVFRAGPPPAPVEFRGIRIGLPICEDLWSEQFCRNIAGAGAELLISIHGSPYWRGKLEQRLSIAQTATLAAGCPVIYANMVGGQDELAFDGGSFGVDWRGEIAFQLDRFAERTEMVSLGRGDDGGIVLDAGPIAAALVAEAADWLACCLGLRDYVGKNGFPGVVIGLSGGIDSAVTATIAVDALGPDRVRCVMLPYRFTSKASRSDAAACAAALGVRLDTIPIEPPVAGFEQALAPLFEGKPRDVTEENIQARTRGAMLMAISNKFGELLVTTGNKSELSVGYATLYGDMNGGFNPIKDLYKTDVYRLARWRNLYRPEGVRGPKGEVIPPAILDKAPSAELRENQTDQDSLPPYDALDAILVELIENERSLNEITDAGHDAATVRKVARMVTLAEYKRRQAAPGVKISRRNFGRDRRYPITNRFVED